MIEKKTTTGGVGDLKRTKEGGTKCTRGRGDSISRTRVGDRNKLLGEATKRKYGWLPETDEG